MSGDTSLGENLPASEAAAAFGRVPTVAELFWGFFVVGITGFGGVAPFARRMLVEQRRWITAEQFTNLWSLCQFLPGPNIINMSLALGQRFRGLPGAMACAVGLICPPFVIILVIGVLYTKYGYVPEVQSVLRGLAAAAAGLFLSTTLKMTMVARPRGQSLVILAVAFGAIAFARLPLVLVLGVIAPVSIALAWFKK